MYIMAMLVFIQDLSKQFIIDVSKELLVKTIWQAHQKQGNCVGPTEATFTHAPYPTTSMGSTRAN